MVLNNICIKHKSGEGMERKDSCKSVRIINHQKFILEKRHLICEVSISNPNLFIDFKAKKQCLYCYSNSKSKVFLLETMSEMTNQILETKIITEKTAKKYLNEHSEGIKLEVYKHFFGEPEEI